MNDPNHQTGTLVQVLRIHVLSGHAESGSAFLQFVVPHGAGADTGSVNIAGQLFEVTTPERVSGADGDAEIGPPPDGVVLSALHLDGGSLKILKAHLDSVLPSVPVAVELLRPADESEFKISCCSCGQKLWVRDEDEGKRGRCPNCRKAFTLPSQESYVRDALKLSESAPIRQGAPGDAEACRQVLTELAALITATLPTVTHEQGDDESDPVSRIPEVPKTDTDVVAPIDDE